MTQTDKLQAAIDWLDTRWLLHPQNGVPKLKEQLPDVFTWTPKVLKAKRVKKACAVGINSCE